MPIIAPEPTRKLLGTALAENYFLRLYTFAPGELVPGLPEYEALPSRDRDHTKRNQVQTIATTGIPGAQKVLEELAKRQQALPHAKFFPMELTDNYTCGMSNPTALENGITLLRPYGVPIVPSSAIKGTVASWLTEVLSGKPNPDDETERQTLSRAGLLALFGWTERTNDGREIAHPGKAVFFDALPLTLSLDADITTVHHQGWYQNEKGRVPAGWSNPTPIPFLAVRKGTRFQFCFAVPEPYVLRQDDLKSLDQFDMREFADAATFLHQALVSTARYKGFGSQTGVGYGRMKPCA